MVRWQLSASNRGYDADFVTNVYRSLGVLQKTNVFVVHKNVHKAADIVLLVANPLLESRIGKLEMINDLTDGTALDLNDFLIIGQLPERGGYSNWDCHKIASDSLKLFV